MPIEEPGWAFESQEDRGGDGATRNCKRPKLRRSRASLGEVTAAQASQLFDQLDANRDGVLSFPGYGRIQQAGALAEAFPTAPMPQQTQRSEEQLMQGMTAAQASALFDQLDSNHDGVLAFQALVTVRLPLGRRPSAPVRHLFLVEEQRQEQIALGVR